MIKSFQSLRALAIIAIMLSHCSFIGTYLPSGLGTSGVSLFISLSGFLTYLSLKDKTLETNLRNVAKRTLHKIKKFYPLHVATFILAVPFVVGAITGEIALIKDIAKGIINLVLLQSWIPIRSVYFSYNAVSWFLSTYIFFVAISPLLMKGLRRLTALRNSLGAALAFLAIIVFLEFLLAFRFGRESLAHWILYIFPITRCLDFISGMLLGFLLTGCIARQYKLPEVVGTIGLVMGLLFEILWVTIDSISGIPGYFFFAAMWCIPSLLLIASAYLLETPQHSGTLSLALRILQLKPLVYLGDISMQLFLVHQLVIKYLGAVFNLALYPSLSLLFCFGISIMIAVTVKNASLAHASAKQR